MLFFLFALWRLFKKWLENLQHKENLLYASVQKFLQLGPDYHDMSCHTQMTDLGGQVSSPNLMAPETRPLEKQHTFIILCESDTRNSGTKKSII